MILSFIFCGLFYTSNVLVVLLQLHRDIDGESLLFELSKLIQINTIMLLKIDIYSMFSKDGIL